MCVTFAARRSPQGPAPLGGGQSDLPSACLLGQLSNNGFRVTLSRSDACQQPSKPFPRRLPGRYMLNRPTQACFHLILYYFKPVRASKTLCVASPLPAVAGDRSMPRMRAPNIRQRVGPRLRRKMPSDTLYIDMPLIHMSVRKRSIRLPSRSGPTRPQLHNPPATPPHHSASRLATLLLVVVVVVVASLGTPPTQKILQWPQIPSLYSWRLGHVVWVWSCLL